MNMKKLNLFFALILTNGMAAGISEAALKYVRAGSTGNNSGSDWSNAYSTLPSSLTRGDTYYIADGSYGSYTFDDANSGTTVITIKKATASDHGTDTGWSSAYGDGQAVFGNWHVFTDYYVFDGQVRNSDWRNGGVSGYGIKVVGGGKSGKTIRLDNGGSLGGDNLTFKYIDAVGGGRDTGNGDDVIYGVAANTNITFLYCSLRDSDRTIFLMRGNWKNLLVDQSYLARNASSPAIHGELLSMTDSDGVTFRNNAIEDIEGTAVFAGLNNGTASNWNIYGNTFHHTAAYKSANREGLSGVVFCANDSSNNNTCNNFLFYNNTLVNMSGLWSGIVIQAGSGNVARNNIWYNSTRTGGMSAPGGNWYYNTIADGDSSSSKQVCSSNCDIFVSLANRDYHLKAATAAGMALSAPYNIDPDNISRGSDGSWDRGAFEYGGTQNDTPTAPLAPTNLRLQ